jgi:hypothetical protein
VSGDLLSALGALAETCQPDANEGMGEAYWRDHAARGDALKPLGRPCHDCAVMCGFYTSLSIELAEQPAVVRDKVVGNWFCHNHRDRACAGNREMVAYMLSANILARSAGIEVREIEG